jgi:phosphonate transport system substrate-binding protein
MRMNRLIAAALTAGLVVSAHQAMATDADCPNGGTVRFAVEPFEAAAKLVPIFDKIGHALGEKLGCNVQVLITTNYTAEIEAMRSGKVDIGEFGPLGYVLAHQVAKAEAVAAYAGADGKPDTYTAGIATWKGSGITDVKDVAGKTFAYSDPASTSGHLFPAYELAKIGIDPDTGIKAIYAGSHTSSFEAIRNHKVQAGELNSSQINSAKLAGEWVEADWVKLWTSDPIPNDPIALRGDLDPKFKARATEVLQTLDFSSALSPTDLKEIGSDNGRLVPQTDAAYDGIRDLVSVLHLDLAKLNE